jgi:hypothetical protein
MYLTNKPSFPFTKQSSIHKTNILAMGFFDAISDTAKRAQLNAEIALIDREMTAQKKAFGIALYDIIDKQHKRKQKSSSDNSFIPLEMPGIFQTIENEIREPWEKYSREIRDMERDKKDLETQVAVLEASKEEGMSKRLSDGAKTAECNVKIAYLDREMKIRKEQFGLAVYDAATSNKWMHEAVADGFKGKGSLDAFKGAVGGIVSGTKGTVTKTLGKLSADEREIETCVNKFKGEIDNKEEERSRKSRELEAIIGSK